MSKAVAVDLDGVLAQYDGWEGLDDIGPPVPGAREFLELVREDLGLEVVVFTTRLNPDPFNEGEQRASPERLQAIVQGWLDKFDLPYDRVFTGRGKPIAVAYVDDRAVLCKPHQSETPQGEWNAALAHINALLEP